MPKNLSVFLLCLTVLGCAHAAPMIIDPNAQPVYGMSKKNMLEVMGKPNYIEIYKKTDLIMVEFDFYIREYKTYQYKLPVCLIGNKVVGWGKTYYEDHVDSDDVRIK